MDTVNQTLLLSLQQEVTTLNEVIKKLPPAKNGEIVRSWLFPSKPFYFVNELIYSDKICESECFKTYLEIIIDRLDVGIRLILYYLEEKTVRRPEENRFIHKPKVTTLGFNFERLWEAVLVLLSQEMDMVKETATGEDSGTTKVFTKETQTSIISLNKCDSCASAMLCMKNLLQSFNKYQLKMTSNEKKQLLRPKIYDITQFGCMLQTTSSIEKGLNRLYEKLFAKEQERDSLYYENQQLKTQITEKCGRITFLQEERNMLKTKMERDSIKITLLNNKIKELSQIKNKQDCDIKILNENVSNLNKFMKANNKTMFKLVSEKAHLSSLYKGIMGNQLRVIAFSTFLKTRLTAIEDEHATINNSFKLLEEIMDGVNKTLNKINNVLTAVDMKMSKVKALEDTSLLESKLQQILQKKQGEEEITKVGTNLQKNSFQIKGNPVEDLTRQIEENNVSIKKLENENIKLKCIISKLTSRKQ